jgi:hypothetical protein
VALQFPFEERAIAFLDILGFKEFILKAECDPGVRTQFLALKASLDNHVLWANQALNVSVPEEVRPKYVFVSDSIIVSAPLVYNGYDGLGIVVLKVIEIAHKLFELGFMISGAITVGSAHHDGNNIFGSGYMRAYVAQQKESKPRVALDIQASEHWSKGSIGGAQLSSLPLCIKYEWETIVDILCPHYIRGRETHGREETVYLKYRNTICDNLSRFHPTSSPYEKWHWMKHFFNQTISRYGLATSLIQ